VFVILDDKKRKCIPDESRLAKMLVYLAANQALINDIEKGKVTFHCAGRSLIAEREIHERI